MQKVLDFFLEYKYLLLIVILAFALRFELLSFVPPSLNWDEVSHGYNAYSILKAGRDEWGVSFPTIFRAYGDYKLPVYIYVTAVSEFFLGLNEVAVRIPSVIAGVATVFFTYLLVRQLTRNKTISLISAFLVAVEPWDLLISRFASEANLSLSLIVAGTYFFVLGLKRKSWIFVFSMICFGLSVWTYNSARIFTPLFLIGLVVVFRDKVRGIFKNRKLCLFSLVAVALFFIPMFIQLIMPSGSARYQWVQILNQGSINKITDLRNNSTLPLMLKRVVFNKATYFASVFVTNYFSHFTPQFLFIKGGSDYQFNLPNWGLLYFVDAPFFIVGLIYLFKNLKKEKFSQIIFLWLLLGPVAASLTSESPHTLRDIVSLPAPMLVTAVGVYTFFTWVYKRFQKESGKLIFVVLVIAYVFILGSSIETYGKKLLFDYRDTYSWSWQYGYKEAVSYIKENYRKYDKIVITKKYGEPHEFLLFFWPWSPESYRNDPRLVRFFQTNWYWVDRFDKFYFVNDWEIPHDKGVFVLESKKEDVDCQGVKCLLVTSPGNFPKGWSLKETINFLNGKPAFEIYEN